jgi:hypothetical protein
MIFVAGSPSAAENPPRDAIWRRAISDAVRGSGPAGTVRLDFRLGPARTRIDLDNLTRLAIDGLRDGGVLNRGLAALWRIEATKVASTEPGLAIEIENLAMLHEGSADGGTQPPGIVDLDVIAELIPREGRVEEKREWRASVANQCSEPLQTGMVFVDIGVRTGTSLRDLMKPIIDGLEPALGRDPRGRLEFCPNDERVPWLRITRVVRGPTLRVRAGMMPVRAARHASA